MAVGGFISIQRKPLISEVACIWKMVVTANAQQMMWEMFSQFQISRNAFNTLKIKGKLCSDH